MFNFFWNKDKSKENEEIKSVENTEEVSEVLQESVEIVQEKEIINEVQEEQQQALEEVVEEIQEEFQEEIQEEVNQEESQECFVEDQNVEPQNEFQEEVQESAQEDVHENVQENIQEKAQQGFGFSLFNLKETIEKTGKSLIENVVSVFSDGEKIDEDMIDEIEENLIKADLGVSTSSYIADTLRSKKNVLTTSNLKSFLREEFLKILDCGKSSELDIKPYSLNIFLVVGVNGAGKTTLIGKLAYSLKNQGKRVLIAAGDTFRAAAEEQLEIWSKRAGADIVRQDGADSAAVVFDAIRKAKNESYDILLIDTAGRLQNKFNLMEELRKIKKVIDKEASENMSESILVLDATTGQNGLKQAEVFKEAVDLSSVALTKLDGSAKGGIVISIAKEMNLPVKLVGVGEKLDDIRNFNSKEFVEALFDLK